MISVIIPPIHYFDRLIDRRLVRTKMTDHHLGMYSTKRLHKGLVENNQYLCVGDKYTDPVANTFRSKPKGQPEPKAFNIKVI